MASSSSRTKWTLVICILLASLVLPQVRPVVAETFSLSALPGRVVEGYASGVHLVLYVSSAQVGLYIFTWTVVDPSGTSTTVTKNTPSTGGTWNQTALYPSDFSASLNLVGTYSVNVAEVSPATNPSVQKTTFQVGLTDSQAYQRNSIVQITGTGYAALDKTTVDLVIGSTNAPGFPRTVNATTGGVVALSWQTYPSTPVGAYTVSLTGTSTPAKTPPDTQQFILNPTNTTFSVLQIGSSPVTRTQALTLKFNASYLNGSPATTGSTQIQLTEPDGVTQHLVTASFNSTTQSFTTYYTTSLSTQTGTWSAAINKGAFDDSYGNNGPLSTVSSTFTVGVAVLTVNNQATNTTYSSGNIIPIVSRVLTPSGVDFIQGTVTATFTSLGSRVATQINLVYDQTQGRWTGSYKVAPTDPSGTWLLTVQAQDAYGNNGQTTLSFNVNTPGPSGPPNPILASLMSWTWLIAVLAAVGLGFAILIFRHRNVSHREVKLDLQAIHTKAEEVKSDDFLQSIKTQLKRRADMLAEEKKEPQEKLD